MQIGKIIKDENTYQNAKHWQDAGFSIFPLNNLLQPAIGAKDWDAVENKPDYFSQNPECRVGWKLPAGFIAITNSSPDDETTQYMFLAKLNAISNLSLNLGGVRFSAYRGTELFEKLRNRLPAGIELIATDGVIPLGDYEQHLTKERHANAPEDILGIDLSDVDWSAAPQASPRPKLDPEVHNTPLQQYSLRGQGEELSKNAKEVAPLLGEVCKSGQSTVWYAPPNSGKTLIGLHLLLEAIEQRRIEPGNVFYINADDNSAGLAEKVKLLDDAGAHTLAPGHREFTADKLLNLLSKMSNDGSAHGILIIIDTVKKFASLMDKRDSSKFASACREFVAKGGTLLAFAHTNKNTDANGNLRHAGTTDLVDDFDAAFIITPIEPKMARGNKVATFKVKKRRGNAFENTAYSFSTEPVETYEELLASVQLVSGDKLDEIENEYQQRSDAEIISEINNLINSGTNTKMILASCVSKKLAVSKKSVLRVIDKYTGDTAGSHHWNFKRGEHGKHEFHLLDLDN